MGWRSFSGMGHLLGQKNLILMGIWVLHAVEKWCDEVDFSINPDKTGSIVLTRRKKIHVFTTLRDSLRRCMSVSYLEVVLDSRLTWREHVDIKVRKAQNVLRACGAT